MAIIWAIEREIQDVEAELRTVHASQASVRARLSAAWQDRLDASAVAELNRKARELEKRGTRLERRLEKLHLRARAADGLKSPFSVN